MGADGGMPAELELDLSPEPASVTRARHAATEVARRTGAPEENVALAVSEAVGNAVVHAFRGRRDGRIRVTAREQAGALIVTVSDNGQGMAPDMEGRGLGVGITLIAQLAGDLRLKSSERGTSVSMSFQLPGRPARDRRAPAPERG